MHNKRCEETRPCQYCIDLGNQCVTATRKGRGHGTRVKAVSPVTYFYPFAVTQMNGLNTGVCSLQVLPASCAPSALGCFFTH